MTTPAERLIAAADLLDKRAGEATRGPWRATTRTSASGGCRAEVQGDPKEGNCRTADGKGWTEVCRGDADGAGPGPFLMLEDAQYIATMNPEVGKAIAAWLRVEAACATRGQGWESEALALADLLLAGAS